jgi:hypothetical protein
LAVWLSGDRGGYGLVANTIGQAGAACKQERNKVEGGGGQENPSSHDQHLGVKLSGGRRNAPTLSGKGRASSRQSSKAALLDPQRQLRLHGRESHLNKGAVVGQQVFP